jgi:hypothetical protein
LADKTDYVVRPTNWIKNVIKRVDKNKVMFSNDVEAKPLELAVRIFLSVVQLFPVFAPTCTWACASMSSVSHVSCPTLQFVYFLLVFVLAFLPFLRIMKFIAVLSTVVCACE